MAPPAFLLCLDVKNNARILLLPTYYSTTEFIFYNELQYLTYQQIDEKTTEKRKKKYHTICTTITYILQQLTFYCNRDSL